MEVQRIYTGNALRNYDYILTTSCGKVLVLDPSDPDLIQRSLQKKVDYYLITHEHPDHIAGLHPLREEWGGEVVAYRELVGQIPVDRPMVEGDVLAFARESLRAIHIPGHIPSHIGFILEKRGRQTAAFLGDTVFNGGVGNTRCGSSPVLYRTIKEKNCPSPPLPGALSRNTTTGRATCGSP